MTKINIDEVSAEVKAMIGTMKLGESEVEQTRRLAQPKLALVWKALEAKQVVSECKNKKEWAKYAGVTPRYTQMILRGERGEGSGKKRTTVRMPTLKVGDVEEHGQQAQAGRPVEDRVCAGVQTQMNHANLPELKDWYQEEKPKRLSERRPLGMTSQR